MSKITLPNDVKPEDVMHPNGTYFRNPSDKTLRDRAQDQTAIVDSISGGNNRKKTTEVFQYRPQDEPFTLPGVLKLREMNSEQIKAFFKNLMRVRPNILKVHIKMGEYPSSRPLRDRKIDQIGSSEPRYSAELAEDLKEVFSDKRLMVVELIYTVHNADAGNFSSSCEAYGVTAEEYENDEFFKPALLIEYFSNI
jgi:hypothetical protein